MFAARAIIFAPVKMKIEELERTVQTASGQPNGQRTVPTVERGSDACAIIFQGERVQPIVIRSELKGRNFSIFCTRRENVDRRLILT